MLQRLTFLKHRLVFIYYSIIPNINDSLRTVDPILSLSVYFCLWFSTYKVLTTLCIIMELSGPLSTLTYYPFLLISNWPLLSVVLFDLIYLSPLPSLSFLF